MFVRLLACLIKDEYVSLSLFAFTYVCLSPLEYVYFFSLTFLVHFLSNPFILSEVSSYLSVPLYVSVNVCFTHLNNRTTQITSFALITPQI